MIQLPVVNVNYEVVSQRHHRGIRWADRDVICFEDPEVRLSIDARMNTSELRRLNIAAEDVWHGVQEGVWVTTQRLEGLHSRSRSPNDAEAIALGRLALQRGLTVTDILAMRSFQRGADRAGVPVDAVMQAARSLSQNMWRFYDGHDDPLPSPVDFAANQIILAGKWDLDELNRAQEKAKKPILAIGPRKLLLPRPK